LTINIYLFEQKKNVIIYSGLILVMVMLRMKYTAQCILLTKKIVCETVYYAMLNILVVVTGTHVKLFAV